jgi:hypothetical protein
MDSVQNNNSPTASEFPFRRGSDVGTARSTRQSKVTGDSAIGTGREAGQFITIAMACGHPDRVEMSPDWSCNYCVCVSVGL